MTPDFIRIKDRSRRPPITSERRGQRIYLRFVGTMFICLAPVVTLIAVSEFTWIGFVGGMLSGALAFGFGIGCWYLAPRIRLYR